MAQNRLPPIRLTSPSGDSMQSTENRSMGSTMNARRKRRTTKLSENEASPNEATPVNSDRPPRAPNPTQEASSYLGETNNGFVPDSNVENDLLATKRSRRRRTGSNMGSSSLSQTNMRRPPRSSRSKSASRTEFVSSNIGYLEGLEEDVIELEDEDHDTDQASPQQPSDTSQRGLLDDTADKVSSQENGFNFKSTPTDKFYLELEKKFAIQKKELYEKRKQERMAQNYEQQLKELQREDQKYQISTPRTALFTHRFIRTLCLFIHGVNVGFQFWQVLLIFFLNTTPFQVDKSQDTFNNDNYFSFLASLTPIFVLYQNLALPFHCLSYFFLTICIVDSMDRVDFTGMTIKHLIKCLSFQNQFWSIVFYGIALILSLTLVYIDETVYFTSFLQTYYVQPTTKTAFTNYLTNGAGIWRGLCIAKTVMCFLAWLLFSAFIKHDRTYELLEKRDFSLLDDIANNQINSEQDKNAPSAAAKPALAATSQVPKLPDIHSARQAEP